MKGYVYVLTNDAMPNLVKIGRSVDSGNKRAHQMYKGDTGVPIPFNLVFELLFDDCVEAEALAHEELADHRVNPNREFFAVEEGEAIKTLLGLRAGYIDCFIEDGPFFVDPSTWLLMSNKLDYPWQEVAGLVDHVTIEQWRDVIKAREERGKKWAEKHNIFGGELHAVK